jgi:nucleotide-binding universal stress UspA family protein
MTGLLSRPVVPVASVEDAERTCRALEPYLAEIESVVSLHVIESASGPSDPTSARQREEAAEEVQDVMRQLAPNVELETTTVQGGDPAGRILEVTDVTDATAIAFTPRPGGRLVRWLSGDVANKLIENDRHPVVVLPLEAE